MHKWCSVKCALAFEKIVGAPQRSLGGAAHTILWVVTHDRQGQKLKACLFSNDANCTRIQTDVEQCLGNGFMNAKIDFFGVLGTLLSL